MSRLFAGWWPRGFPVNAADKEDLTPLHYAAETYDTDTVNELIALGADVNALDVYQRTPLHLAAWVGSAEVALALMAAGADPYAVMKSGKTPLDIARENRKPPFIRTLEKAYGRLSPAEI